MKFKLSFFWILTVAMCQSACSLSENQNQNISRIKDEEFDLLLSNQIFTNQFIFNDGAFYYPYDGCEYIHMRRSVLFMKIKQKHGNFKKASLFVI